MIQAVILGFVLNFAVITGFSTQEKKEAKQKGENKPIYIPKEVKTIFQEGMKTRQPHLDIPFTIVENLYLPAQSNIHSIFIFKVKNADLGFAPIVLAPEKGKEEEEKQQKSESSSEPMSAELQARNHIFIQVNRKDSEFVKEIYIPFNLSIESASYDPNKEEIYTVGYPLPPGDYLLSMAIASKKLEKIGTQYFELSLPDSLSFTENLDTTPIFFSKNIQKISSPESIIKVHKEFFTYSALQIEPNLEKVFSPGENLDIFFFIFGTKPDEQKQFDIDINYEVLKGEEKIIRYASQKYNFPLVSQPLPMKKTVLIKTKKGETIEERKEQRDLGPGIYTLSIDIKDNISGLSLKKAIDFEVK